jgi:YD repeat-containing protein
LITGATILPYAWPATGDDASAGWLYTLQTYDWKGRPLVTTNPSVTSNPAETTTKVASYSGCGCAGGEVVTLTDEVGRRQKVYSDVLGRTAKTEVLNWDGSVFSYITSAYDALDQVTAVRQYDAATAVYHETTRSYDGYGRLKAMHAPEQQVDPNNGSSTDHTTWDYNADDTIPKVTNARGATATYGYNNRHLVTSVTYRAPTVSSPGSAIPVPPPVTFDYDAAGNRLGMNENSIRKVTYHYDALSQMDWEDRQLPGTVRLLQAFVRIQFGRRGKEGNRCDCRHKLQHGLR